MHDALSDADRAALDTMRQAALRWLNAASIVRGTADPEATKALVAVGRALLQLDPDRLDALLRRAPRAVLVLLQQFGRAAFRALVGALLADPSQLERLRRFSSRLIEQFHSPPGIDRSDLYMQGVLELLKKEATRWPDFEDEHALDQYLMEILRNTLRRSTREKRPRADSEEVLAGAAGGELPPNLVAEQTETIDAVARAERELEARLARLHPPQLRAVCLLRWRHGWSFPELALVWPDDSEPANQRQNQQTRARWIARRYQEFVDGHEDPPAAHAAG